MPNMILSIKEAAEVLGVSRQAIHARIKAGKIYATPIEDQFGGTWKWGILEEDLHPAVMGRPRKGKDA